MKYYIKAHYPQGQMFELFEGEANALYEQVTNDLADPENFRLELSTDPIYDFNPCTIDDLKAWANDR